MMNLTSEKEKPRSSSDEMNIFEQGGSIPQIIDVLDETPDSFYVDELVEGDFEYWRYYEELREEHGF